MPASRDHGFWLDPKWLVSAVALAAGALIVSYDVRLGLAFAAVVGVILALWFYVALRFGSLSGAPASGRHALVARFQLQSSHRRRAAQQSTRTGVESRPQQPPEPPQRP